MVAYSFQRRFCDMVASREKRQTIRSHRVRHVRPGEAIQLFFGMRTKQCRKLLTPDPVCVSVDPIGIIIPPGEAIAKVRCLNLKSFTPVSDRFAQLDGFEDALDFTQFWREMHGSVHFEGVLIRWGQWNDGYGGAC